MRSSGFEKEARAERGSAEIKDQRKASAAETYEQIDRERALLEKNIRFELAELNEVRAKLGLPPVEVNEAVRGYRVKLATLANSSSPQREQQLPRVDPKSPVTAEAISLPDDLSKAVKDKIAEIPEEFSRLRELLSQSSVEERRFIVSDQRLLNSTAHDYGTWERYFEPVFTARNNKRKLEPEGSGDTGNES